MKTKLSVYYTDVLEWVLLCTIGESVNLSNVTRGLFDNIYQNFKRITSLMVIFFFLVLVLFSYLNF